MNPSDLLHDWAPHAWNHCWQTTLVAAAVLVVVRFVRRPHLAHLLCLVVLLKCLVPPVWSSPVGLFSWIDRPLPATPIAIAIGSDVGTQVAGSVVPAAPGRGMRDGKTPIDWVALLGVVWLVGFVVVGTLVLVRWMALRRLLGRCESASAAIRDRVDELRLRGGVGRAVQMLVTEERVIPFIVGILRPTIVLPRSLVDELQMAELEPILAHELAHLRRGDLLLGPVQLLAQVVWWFHPLVWWVRSVARRCREECCDGVVVGCFGIDPRTYARSLVDVAELSANTRLPGGVAGLSAFELTASRLKALSGSPAGFRAAAPAWQWLLALAIAAVVLPGTVLPRATRAAGGTARGPETARPGGSPQGVRTDSDARSEPAEPILLRRNVVDGFASDVDHDGTFDVVDTRGHDLRLTLPGAFRTFDHEVGLIEFDASLFDGELLEAVLQFDVTLMQSSNDQPGFEVFLHAYTGDGRIDPADATAPGTLVARIERTIGRDLGTVRVPLDVAVLAPFVERGGWIGLRLSQTGGQRLFVASAEHYVPDSRPAIEIRLRPTSTPTPSSPQRRTP